MNAKKLALIGKDVSDSPSPQIHEFIASRLKIRLSYDRVSVPEERFQDEIESLFQAYEGVNITIPYKLSVIPHLKKLKGDAKIFGSVNTVDCRKREGYNTDGVGFMLMLSGGGADARGEETLVVGAGGAGRSVAKKLSDAGAKVSVYNRTFEKAKELEREFKGVRALKELEDKPYYLIVNATGVGMHTTVGQSPVGENLLKQCAVAADLIYNPARSEFLSIADRAGKKVINGFSMVFYQAYYADCIFFGLTPDGAQAKKIYAEFLKEIG